MKFSVFLIAVFSFVSSLASAEVASREQKLAYAKDELAKIMAYKKITLATESVKIRTGYGAYQIPLQVVNGMESIIPAGENGSGGQGWGDLDVVSFYGSDSINQLY